MDFIFGTFATDDLKIIHHRATMHTIHHGFDIQPLDPEPDQPVTINVTIGTHFSAQQVACYYTTDGSMPEGSKGEAKNGQAILMNRTEIRWDTLAWGYIERWQCVIPAQSDGTMVRYVISAWSADGREVFADYPDIKLTAEEAAAAFFRQQTIPLQVAGNPEGEDFAYQVDTLKPPDWAYKSVIYQVFVDRFYPGDGKEWLNPENLSGFYGGTLWGVRDKLDYIAELGATCLWISPMWVSPSHHGYDVIDYDHVEPRLGGDEALHALVEAAHQRGIRVLLDLVCNHISHEHPIFKSAFMEKNSPYRDWFLFEDTSEIGYRAFFGVHSMPQLNVRHAPARDWMINIARYWLREFDVDGYRLDYANGCGPNFWLDFTRACKEIKPDSFCFGEIVDHPGTLQAYVGKLDGCLDFHVGDALRHTFAHNLWTEADFERFLERHEQFFPKNFLRMSFLDNHDMDRFLFAAKGDKEALRRAAAVQMRLPQPPIIYYGTEVGLNQRYSKMDGFGLEVSREPMLWDEAQDKELLEYYKSLIRQHKTL